jgi:hypothetical protein
LRLKNITAALGWADYPLPSPPLVALRRAVQHSP